MSRCGRAAARQVPGGLRAIPSAPREVGGNGVNPGRSSSGTPVVRELGDPVRCKSPKEENIVCDEKGFTYFKHINNL